MILFAIWWLLKELLTKYALCNNSPIYYLDKYDDDTIDNAKEMTREKRT